MSEVLVQFETIVTASDGRRFVPRACARQDGHVWEGWLEFAPADHKAHPVRTPRETVQPNRDHVLYWAQGLTQVFLEGALSRALRPAIYRDRGRQLTPFFEGPAPAVQSPPAAPLRPRPTLDPYMVYQQGEDVLVEQLSALATPRLRDIVLAYAMADSDRANAASREELTAIIVAGVRRPLAAERPEQRGERRI